MDSYDLFGDDGSGMLEGLPDLGGNHSYTGNSASTVTADTKEPSETSYRQSYPGSVPPEGSLQKLASFGSTGGGGLNSNTQAGGGGNAPEYHEYGGYPPPRPRMPQPPHGPPLHAGHHVHPGHTYAGYHPGPDPMYSMPEHPGMPELGVWSSAAGSGRYPPITPGYRHPYDHQKLHQYSPQQGMQGMPQNGAYLPRQPHFSQPPSQSVYGQQQNYAGYPQVHPPAPSRIGPHAPYHQQMEINAHQYGLPHAQQSLGGVPPQHQPHQSMASHQGGMSSNLQGPSSVHLHHPGAPPLHHSSRQPPSTPTVAATHNVPTQPYSTPHHNAPLNYQPHQLQPSLDVSMGVPSQYGSPKPQGLDSPQYRPPFQQLSPQISPRAQMSPRPQAPPQLSPRPPISPVKGPNASPHAARPVPQAPPSSVSQASAPFSSQNTLQALEQMVLPGASEYAYQRNPASPAISHMVSSPSQWNPSKVPTPSNNHLENVDKSSIVNETIPVQTLPAYAEQIPSRKSAPSIESKHIDFTNKLENLEKPVDSVINISESKSMTINTSIVDIGTRETLSGKIVSQRLLDEKPEVEQSFKLENVANVEQKSLITNENLDDLKHHEIPDKKDLKSDVMEDSVTIAETLPVNNSPSLQTISAIPTVHSQQSVDRNSPINVPQPVINLNSPLNTRTSSPQGLGINRNINYPVSNLTNTAPPTLPNITTPSPGQTVNSNQTNSISNVQANTSQNIQANFQGANALGIPSSAPGLGQMPNNTSNVMSLPQPNSPMTSNLPPPSTQHNMGPNSCLPPMTSMTGNLAGSNTTTVANINNVPPNMGNVSMNMPLNIPMHAGLPPNNQTNLMPPMPHTNVTMMMGPGSIPHPNMQSMYPTPINHHQERAALQQQIQEIFCIPPTPETQEKLRCLQERLSMLQQHETSDNCSGGPNCIFLNPVYGSKMVESPQVSSTTGRGRSKGASRPRKPRAKKEKQNALMQPLDQLPVSEDCVTAGTGLLNTSLDVDGDFNEDLTNLDSSALQYEMTPEGKPKKQRGPRKNKERKPRIPKEQKVPRVKGDKPVKERKKRAPKDPNAPRRKRASKKDDIDVQADTTTSYEFSENNESLTKDGSITSNELLADSINKTTIIDQSKMDDTVTDFDDIPVSKIPIKELLQEAEARRELEEKDDDTDSLNQSSKRKISKRRSFGCKKPGAKRVAGGKRKKRGGIVPESDGEPDDLMSTPPPSPPAEGDCDSMKRRSGRHAQRKKYTDDVMLRLSDEEFAAVTMPKHEKDIKHDQSNIQINVGLKPDGTPKPNYMYVNTTDEDTMIVQHVLASRMGKRELKPDEPPLEKPKEEAKAEPMETDANVKTESVDNEEQKGETLITENKIETETDPQEKEAENISIKEDSLTNNDTTTESKNEIQEQTPSEPKAEPVLNNENLLKEIDAVNTKIEKPIIVDVEEFYVKYRNFSYLHCEWKTEEELYKGDKRIFSKIKRFKQKQAQQVNIFELLDEEPFNPDYTEVERVLDMSDTVDPGNENNVKHYLVKWKSLQYEDSTWELEENIDVDKIKQYQIFNEIPPKEKWKFKRRPCAEQWVQLDESPLYKGGNTLRPYQLEGLNWLLFSWHNNRNCILADEMGLGKTIQSLTFVNSVWEYGIRGPFLIIAPLSTIPNWQREFEGWTDMNVIVYHGSQQSKSMIQEYEFYYKDENGVPIKDITKFNVLITTFEIIVTDFQDLKLFNWRACVIDEAHRLKNRNCKLLEGLRQLHLDHRVLLSGTPLQNNVNELFSLLNFLEPSQFSSSEAFLTEFGQLKTESEVLKLQALLKPMMLRRLKEDVEKTLAPKEETIIEVELTNIQKKYYRAILERNFSFLRKGTASAANIPNLMNTMMELRKCCIHPYLLNGAEDQIQFDYKQAHGEDKQAYYEALIQSSGKMVLVDKLLPKLKAGGHRVLIFSQMVRCLDILEDYLMYRKYPYERIDGRIRGNLRQEAIDRFSKPDSDRFVFLLCTKAGGLGINLTAADTVIIYDSDWNPQNDLQAQARCHRIGQQKMVKIYRLVCRNSYEREMFDKASLKLGLDKAVLQSMNTGQGGKETGLRQLSKKEIEDLLKKGAYGAVMDEDNAGDQFCEEDIEMILARRTQVIQMESEKGSTFSKASFAATDQRSDIDIRDPDFWNKWAKKAEIDPTEKKEDEILIVTEPRRRTLIKRYGHDDSTIEMSDMDATPDSDDDEEGISLRSKKKKDKLGKKGRKYMSDEYVPRHDITPMEEEVIYGSWTRSECFKIERGLLTYGWARWDEIVDKNQFRKGWTIPVIEDCARIIVLYCLRHYKGDEKIRNFIWDLIEPCENGEVTIARNHSGLHNPVPRGRNAKKKNKPKDVMKTSSLQRWEDPSHWSSGEKYDCEAYLENSYKKHLFRHANKVLLRVRMMYYIKHEVIGDYATQIEAGVSASGLGMRVPRGVDSAPPRIWWDTDCDVSLLVGTYVHGYENYLAMRTDPQLCFVEKLGPPDDAECTDIKSEVRVEEDCTDEVSSGAGATSPAASPPREDDATHPWPSMQDLNTRLRRLITAYQRNYKREELKLQQRSKKNERRDRIDPITRDEAAQWRWSRADEESFRRTVASYGVEFDPATKSLRWSRFRALAHLDSKTDDALTDYLKAFMAMCKRQCGLSVGEAELPTRSDLKAEPIGEERAIATLERIDLLRVLREEVAPHPALEARLSRCERSAGVPAWWSPAAHDRFLILAVCKHGLGDTYHKLFCDPKLPFADCAAKWAATNKPLKPSDKMSSDEEEDLKTVSEHSETHTSLRRSKRNSNNVENSEVDDDTDALSELETLAKLGRTEEPLPQSYWFSERALETRLHHIAHTVQNSEWPTTLKSQRSGESSKVRGKSQDDNSSKKHHIAIDVETDRAKLHALLSSPHPAHSRDDASSDSGSRRSTPAPPPAHQRIAPSPVSTPAPVDLSAPLDLSEAQDFSKGRRTPATEVVMPSAPTTPTTPVVPTTPSKGRLDDTLSKLMKRKNVPEPEVIVGKEKKRKKLDEIVLGLSAAKGHSVTSSFPDADPGRNKNIPIIPNVSVTPASSSSTHSALHNQKPFSVTVTNVPSPQATPKELSSFLQQSLEQSTPKSQKMPPSLPKPYSHEAKVNKWLAEQASADSRRRTPAPRLAPDEHVPVVHRVTGKRLVGHKAPQLKHLAQWIAENPMYDIDSKWTEGIKEHVKLPQDVRAQRHSPMQSSSSVGSERKKGRPPTLDTSAASAHLSAQSMAGLNPALLASLSSLGGFDQKSLAATLSNLTGFDSKSLAAFDPKLLANLNSFDPKNNPLLSSFNSMPNLLGNLTGGNLFANLANLGLSGFPGMDMNIPGSNIDSKSKSRKHTETSASSSKSSNSQFPFAFPNHNMLYPQLGLSGLNPFGMQAGISSAYDALGLLNSSLATSSSSLHGAASSSRTSSSKTSIPRSSTVTTNSSSSHSRQQKTSSERQHSGLLPQMLLPDAHLLESLSKQYESSSKLDKRPRDLEMLDPSVSDLSKSDRKRHQHDPLRAQLPPEFAAVQERLLKGDKRDIDISKMLLEQMASGALSASLVSSVESKKISDTEKEAYEKMARNATDYSVRNIGSENCPMGQKRPHDDHSNEPENLVMTSDLSMPKQKKETDEREHLSKATDKQSHSNTHTGEMDLEDLIAPSTVIKTGIKPSTSDLDNVQKKVDSMHNLGDGTEIPTSVVSYMEGEISQRDHGEIDLSKDNIEYKDHNESNDNVSSEETTDLSDAGRRNAKKKGRKSTDESTWGGVRRELRSSTGRQSTR